MPPLPHEPLEIKPAAPEAVIEELLMVSAVQRLPMQAGDIQEISGRWEEYQIIAAVQGSLTASLKEGYLLIGQDQALCCRETCTLQAVSDCLCMLIRLRGELVRRLLGDRMADTVLFPQGAAAVREAALSLAVLEREQTTVNGEAASAYAYTMLVKLRSAPVGDRPKLSPLVESAIAIIQEEFPYLEGMDELAARLEVSKAHLIRTFVKKTGVSPGKYLTRVRIEYAKLLLSEEDASVAYAAGASGFANANYFAKVFRKETGMSPTEFMESAPRRMPQLPAAKRLSLS